MALWIYYQSLTRWIARMVMPSPLLTCVGSGAAPGDQGIYVACSVKPSREAGGTHRMVCRETLVNDEDTNTIELGGRGGISKTPPARTVMSTVRAVVEEPKLAREKMFVRVGCTIGFVEEVGFEF